MAIKGEDMDACLEQVNKDSKVWQHGSMVAMDWFRIFSNLENLSKVCYSERHKWISVGEKNRLFGVIMTKIDLNDNFPSHKFNT